MSTTLHIEGKAVTIDILERKTGEIRFTLNGKTYHFMGQVAKDGSFRLDEETAPGTWTRTSGACWKSAKATRVQLGALETKLSQKQAIAADSKIASALSPVAPMPGLVRKLMVKKGDKVVEGQALVVFEAMKLQLTLNAGADAVVTHVPVHEGELVSEGTELVTLTAKAGK